MIAYSCAKVLAVTAPLPSTLVNVISEFDPDTPSVGAPKVVVLKFNVWSEVFESLVSK